MSASTPAPTILLVAGEPSGDTHGAELIHALRRLRPDVRCLGVGGSRMKSAGQDQLYDLSSHAVIGLVEVLKHYPRLRSVFNALLRLAVETAPEAVIFIDYPGFNLRLAKALRRLLPNTRLIYYISPQVWAWKAGRAKEMAKTLALLLVIIGFEKDWFSQNAPRLRVEWVGHPIWDRIMVRDANLYPSPSPLPPPLPSAAPLRPPSRGEVPARIALLPGSREGEIRKHLPILIRAARELRGRHRNLRLVWICPDAEKQRLGHRIIEEMGGTDLHIESYVGYQLSHLSRCDLALLASGTVSMECACLGLPQIVFYKVHPLTYILGRMLVKTRFVSMVNLLANREVVPEYIQSDLDPSALARHAEALLSDAALRQEMKRSMRQVIEKLGEPGASERAARRILTEIGALVG